MATEKEEARWYEDRACKGNIHGIGISYKDQKEHITTYHEHLCEKDVMNLPGVKYKVERKDVVFSAFEQSWLFVRKKLCYIEIQKEHLWEVIIQTADQLTETVPLWDVKESSLERLSNISATEKALKATSLLQMALVPNTERWYENKVDDLTRRIHEDGVITKWKFFVPQRKDIYLTELEEYSEPPLFSRNFQGLGLQNELSWEDAQRYPELDEVLTTAKSLTATGKLSVRRVHLIHKRKGGVTPWHRDLGQAHIVLYHQLSGKAVFDSTGPRMGLELRKRDFLMKDSIVKFEAYKKWFGEKERDRSSMIVEAGQTALLTPASTHQVWTVQDTFAVGVELEIVALLDKVYRSDSQGEDEVKGTLWTKERATQILTLGDRIAWGRFETLDEAERQLAAIKVIEDLERKERKKDLQDEDSKGSIQGGDVEVSEPTKRKQPDRTVKTEAANSRAIKKLLEEDEAAMEDEEEDESEEPLLKKRRASEPSQVQSDQVKWAEVETRLQKLEDCYHLMSIEMESLKKKFEWLSKKL